MSKWKDRVRRLEILTESIEKNAMVSEEAWNMLTDRIGKLEAKFHVYTDPAGLSYGERCTVDMIKEGERLGRIAREEGKEKT